ncbi:MAG: N-acetylmuramoyl-L-alanine amidase [Synechococcaceae cyanobacterium RL_1_2]|nr:N-acetylmuramoyl-L-alanine amidase [Synechococcaceae cyanobacterium RL_1_2]
MVKLKWLFLSTLSLMCWAARAEAGNLANWNFNRQENRLNFTTTEGVQPSALLIPDDPSSNLGVRVVIDLPGTQLGSSLANQTVGGSIKNVRVGQFNESTTRLVIELALGYTVDPNQIVIQGLTAQNWSVTLPTPELIDVNNTNTTFNTNTSSTATYENFKVTQNGFYVDLNLAGQSNIRTTSTRNQAKNRLDLEIEGINLPSSFIDRTIENINTYQVKNIKFSQLSTNPPVAKVSLELTPDSPDWSASITRSGDLILVPQGRIDDLASIMSNPSTAASQVAMVSKIELIQNQLVVTANAPIQARSQWNQSTGMYEVVVTNAQLSNQLQGPNLPTGSPIENLKVQQGANNTVVLSLRPSRGIQIQNLNQVTNSMVALELKPGQSPNTTASNIDVPPAPPASNNNPTFNNNINPSDILVVLDPGHGGKDPGAVGIGGIREKDIILPISIYIGQLLQSQGIQVRMTRDSDYFVSLAGRAQMANSLGADVFVSVHANAISLSRPEVNGVETYYYQNGKDLATLIHNNIMRTMNVNDRGVRTARFYVLRNTSMPSVLVEVGFTTGREDAPRLVTNEYQQQMAQAITNGILQYIQQAKL